MKKTLPQGITLIELMIAVSVIAILSAIAYPSYLSHVQSSRRAEAKAGLMELTQFMERQYAATGSYVLPTGTTLPFTTIPKDGSGTYYNLTLTTSAATFTLTATPTGSMSSDSCGTMTLDQIGNQTPTTGDCW